MATEMLLQYLKGTSPFLTVHPELGELLITKNVPNRLQTLAKVTSHQFLLKEPSQAGTINVNTIFKSSAHVMKG